MIIMKRVLPIIMIILMLSGIACAIDNPKAVYGDVSVRDVAVNAKLGNISLSDTSKINFDNGEYTHQIGRLNIQMIPNVKTNYDVAGLKVPLLAKQIQFGGVTSYNTGNTIVWNTDDASIKYTLYKDLIKEHVTLQKPSDVSYSYNIWLTDWTVTNKDGTKSTTYAKDSTTDINLDRWGNLIITINGEETVVIPRPYAIDTTDKYYDMSFELDKQSKTISIVGDLKGAVYPIIVDPTERVTNGGFETGDASGWTATSGIYFITDAPVGTYYAILDSWTTIYLQQSIDLTNVNNITMKVQIFDLENSGTTSAAKIKINGTTVLSQTTPLSWDWYDKTYNVSALSGSNVLRFETVSGSKVGIGIDNVSALTVDELPPAYDLTITSKSPTANNVTTNINTNQNFTISTNQTANVVKWYVGNTLVKTDNNVTSSYYNGSVSTNGGHVVSVNVTNNTAPHNDTESWLWINNDPSDEGTIYKQWGYKGEHVPVSSGENFIFNLWIAHDLGEPTEEFEVVISDFSFEGTEEPDIGNVEWDRYFEWKNYTWDVSNGVWLQDNHWSDSEDNLWIDEDDKLHMRLTYNESTETWYSAELNNKDALGYGEYSWVWDTNLSDIDPYIVVAGFLYESGTEELDIEIAKWGTDGSEHNADYITQPLIEDETGIMWLHNQTGRTLQTIHWKNDSVVWTSRYLTDDVVSISAITGLTIPVAGESQDTTIVETDEYTGTVTWNPTVSTYGYNTVYSATITLTPKSGYTLTGVTEDFFTVNGATTYNDANSGVVTATFPATEEEDDTIVNITAIGGLTAPVQGDLQDTTITETDQYTGSVSWSPNDETYDYSTIYSATITLNSKDGYTFAGVSEDFFTVSGATTTNSADSGVVTAVFPATCVEPIPEVVHDYDSDNTYLFVKGAVGLLSLLILAPVVIYMTSIKSHKQIDVNYISLYAIMVFIISIMLYLLYMVMGYVYEM